MTNRTYKRRRKLVKPRLQLRLTLMFVGLSALALLLQFVLFSHTVTSAALSLPNDDALLLERASGLLLRDMLFSLAVFLPLMFAVGILMTFRVAGPVYRFETFLRQIRRGEKPLDFRLRKGDELQDLADLLNEVTEPLRRADAPARDAPEADDPPSLLPREHGAPAAASEATSSL